MYPATLENIKKLFSEIATLRNDIGNIVYPVGSIYMSMNETDPATLFGGTWERLANGRCLIGGGESSGYTVGSTGGEKTHTLTAGEMPTHNHGATTANGGHSHDRGTMDMYGTFRSVDIGGNEPSNGVFVDDVSSTSGGITSGPSSGFDETISFLASRNWYGLTSTVDNHQHTTQDAGSGQSHNNMQPYLAVAIWKRTA